MQNSIKILSLLIFIIIAFFNTSMAQSDGSVTGFLLRMDEVKQLTDQGAKAIKVFAAKDDNGATRYVMVGLEASGTVMKKKIFVNDGTGDCPPSCDFLPKNLTSATLMDGSAAATLVENYMKSFPTIENAVIICVESIEKVAEKYNYMKVTINDKVRVTGVKDDGGIPFLAPFSKDCNKAERSTL